MNKSDELVDQIVKSLMASKDFKFNSFMKKMGEANATLEAKLVEKTSEVEKGDDDE